MVIKVVIPAIISVLRIFPKGEEKNDE